MKRIDKVIIAVLGVLCLGFAACSKVETNPYSDYVWTGEYPIQTQNGTTGEMEDHTGVIILQFLNNGIECIVDTGIVGMVGTNRRKFEARWSGKESFSLYRISGGQSLLEYMGTISGDIMLLEALNCDSVAATYELSGVLLVKWPFEKILELLKTRPVYSAKKLAAEIGITENNRSWKLNGKPHEGHTFRFTGKSLHQ